MIALRMTRTIWGLIIACVAVFVLQKLMAGFAGVQLIGLFGLVPESVAGGALWQLLTYMFLHADVGHLVLNMLMLAFIGSELEAVWGRRRFLLFYFFCGAFAALCYLLLQLVVWQASIPMVGASGGIYGLLLAYGLLFGERVLLFMLLFPMKARHFIWVLAGVEFLSGLFSGAPGSGLSSVAHLGGMAGGFSYLYGRGWWLVLKRRRDSPDHQRAKRVKKSHLKLVVDKKSPSKDSDRDPHTWH